MNSFRLAFRLLLSAAMLQTGTADLQAQADSTRSTARMIAVGAANVLDTYLSPEKYRGTELRYLSHSTRPTRWHHISQTLLHQGSIVTASNRADNNDELGGQYTFQYHLRYNWQLTPELRLAAGAGLGADIGFLYNTRNGNNPAQARFALNLMPSLSARYDTRIRAWDIRIGYEATAPLLGIMFSPNYGQSYYEIFNEGNNDHNIVPTTIAATPSMAQLVTIDLRPWRKWRTTWLRLGYLGDYWQAEVNHLKYHHYSHLIILGYVKTL